MAEQRPGPDDKAVATVFYDGGCPLCRREIAHYRRLDADRRLGWVDITDGDQHLPLGLTRERAMARFHVLDSHGRWHTGAWGFAELWSHLPGYRLLAHASRWLGAVRILDGAYTRFTRWRLRRRCRQECA